MSRIRHVVTLHFDGAPAGTVSDIVARLRRLPETIDTIDSYSVGIDLGLADGNATVGIVADFASVDAYEVYRDHADHQAVIAESIRPVLTARSAIQYELIGDDS